MIEEGLVQKHIVGRDGFVWWIGQVASDSWKDNIPGSTSDNIPVEDQKGFEYRYQVRIIGYHTADTDALKTEQLPWATVMYPITAGGGGGPFFSTPNIKAGNFVYGFFFDGQDAQQPVIMGILGYNQYQDIAKQNPNLKGFAPFLGQPNQGVGSEIATYAATLKPRSEDKKASKNLVKNNTTVGSDETVSDKQQEKDGKTTDPQKYPANCKESKSPGGIQKDIQNMIQAVQDAQSELKNAKRVALNTLQVDGVKASLDVFKENELAKAALSVTGFMKNVTTEMEKFKTDTINKNIRDKLDDLLPNELVETKKEVDTALDLVGCLFRKIIGNLFDIVKNALSSILERYINAPICAVENVVGSILGKLTGFIDSSINAIMAPLQALLGITDIAGSALGFIEGFLSFLSCDETPACAGSKGYSLWDGADIPTATFDPSSLINKVKDFASSVTQAINPDNFDFSLDMNFKDLFGQAVDDCNVGPLLCGPPRVEFFGGSGSGAKGNAIVNGLGQLLGVDIISTGSGYASRAPIVRFIDDCGNGQGAGGLVDVVDGEVVAVTITSPGTGYIPVPNGSQGGDGRTWAQPQQTTIRHDDATWDVPWDPGENIPVKSGDVIRIPLGGTADINGEVIPPGKDFEIPSDGIVTAPPTSNAAPSPGDYPLANLRYPVIMYLCDTTIESGGFGYQEGDKVVVEPDYGIEIVPTFGRGGDLVDLKITSGGEGVKEIPDIYIESETGFNAKILPRFCIDRLTDEVKVATDTDKVISVVDCVGKI